MTDTIIIGTSPLAITEAVYLRSKGKSTVNIDDKPSPGGAWVAINYKTIPKVEIGCHIWSYHKETYDFISKFFGLEIVDLPVQPRIVYKDRFVPYDLKANLITFKTLTKSLFKLKFSIFRELKSHPELRLSIVPSRYKYPKYGAREVEEAVLKLISDNDLKVLLKTEIKSVQLTKDGGDVMLKNGEKESFKNELVLTSLSQLEEIIFEDGSVIEPSTKEVQYIHRHLIVSGTLNKKFTYLRLMNDKLIHRISDMTSQVQNELPLGTFLICVGIHESAFHVTDSKTQEIEILKTLKYLKLFNDDAEVVQSESNVYPSFYNDTSTFGDIEKRSNGKIRFLRSTDFVYSFFNQLERYKTLLD